MSLNDAAYSAGLTPIAYSFGGTKPRPPAASQAGVEAISVSIDAHSGVDDEVPPNVVQPPNWLSYTVIAPVNSSACAVTSGTSRQTTAPQKSLPATASARLTIGALSNPGTFVPVCQDGAGQTWDMPPPPAPQLEPSFQICSAGGKVGLVIAVPPTEST